MDVGAINCERAGTKKLCADWLAVDSYPSLYLLNRKHGTIAKYPKDADKAPDKVAKWATETAQGWRGHLFPASNLTTLNAGSFEQTVLADTSRAWIVRCFPPNAHHPRVAPSRWPLL